MARSVTARSCKATRPCIRRLPERSLNAPPWKKPTRPTIRTATVASMASSSATATGFTGCRPEPTGGSGDAPVALLEFPAGAAGTWRVARHLAPGRRIGAVDLQEVAVRHGHGACPDRRRDLHRGRRRWRWLGLLHPDLQVRDHLGHRLAQVGEHGLEQVEGLAFVL